MSAKPCPEEPEPLYYIVRVGTNARLTNKDNVPLLVTRGQLALELQHYRDKLPYRVHHMSVREWHEMFWIPVLRLKDQLYKDAFSNADPEPDGGGP